MEHAQYLIYHWEGSGRVGEPLHKDSLCGVAFYIFFMWGGHYARILSMWWSLNKVLYFADIRKFFFCLALSFCSSISFDEQ